MSWEFCNFFQGSPKIKVSIHTSRTQLQLGTVALFSLMFDRGVILSLGVLLQMSDMFLLIIVNYIAANLM